MRLDTSDWIVLVLYGLVCVAIGLAVVRRAGQGRAEFFLSGRRLPWWLLGVSLVATTFSTDTPNLITDLVRSGGVSQNWVWWAFAVTGMCTVFFYAKLWRRSAALTDIAFYEIRYSGKPAAFLRGFRAIYLGVFFNVMIMASVNLSATKIAGVMLGWDRHTAVLIGGGVTVLYAASSGLSGVVLTDFVQFLIAMVGAVMAAVVALGLPQVGGLSGLFHHPAVAGRLSLLPDFSDWRTAAAVFIVPLAVQWWSTGIPGAPPLHGERHDENGGCGAPVREIGQERQATGHCRVVEQPRQTADLWQPQRDDGRQHGADHRDRELDEVGQHDTRQPGAGGVDHGDGTADEDRGLAIPAEHHAGDFGRREIDGRHDHDVEEHAEVDRAKSAQERGGLAGVAQLVERDIGERRRSPPQLGVEEHGANAGDGKGP